MNIHTFGDVAKSKRSSLVHDLYEDDDEDEDRLLPSKKMEEDIEGEEELGAEKVHIFILKSCTIALC